MLPMLLIAALQTTQESPATAKAVKELVRIEELSRGCYHDDEKKYEWVVDGDVYRCGERTLKLADVAAIRSAIVAARHEVPESDLLAEVGVTKESLAAHRDEILRTALPEAYQPKEGGAPELPAEVAPLLAWDAIAPKIRDELLGKWWGSTESRLVRVTFVHGDDTLVVESEHLVPWMLPWRVKRGDASFESEDLAVPRGLLKLFDPKGPCASFVDGSSYWPAKFWSNRGFWDRFVGAELDRVLSKRRYEKLAGWERFSSRFDVRKVETGCINLQPDSIYFQLEAKTTSSTPSSLDQAWWFDHVADGKPKYDWNDFLSVFDAASALVAQQKWLLDWRKSNPTYRLELQVAGKAGFAETMVDVLVLPAWTDAGFEGRPEFELLLRRGSDWCGTVYLSSQATGALIETAKRAKSLPENHHWFDDLDFSYHPRANPPTYGRVDAEGKLELRTTKRLERRPSNR